MSRSSRALLQPAVGWLVIDRAPLSSRRGRRRHAPLIARDPYLAYSASLTPIAALVLLLSRGWASLVALAVLAVIFVGKCHEVEQLDLQVIGKQLERVDRRPK